MTVSYTASLHIPIPDFLSEPWHAELESSIRALDTAIYQALIADNVAAWLNNHVYAIGDLAIDSGNGKMYSAGVAHTSPVSPTTFTTFRAANPTYWNAIANVPQQRGTWQTATSYLQGDFVIDSNRYAVCIVAHVSGTFNTDLASGKWVVLLDLSTLGVGLNLTAEASVASGATVDVGAQVATRLFVTGSTTITSYGAIANVFKIIRFEGVLTLTNSANLVLIGAGVNRVTRAGDQQMVTSDSTGKFREILYTRADGNPATTTERGVIELATGPEAVALTDTARGITPSTLAAVLNQYIEAGTKMLFQQTTAPTGWTKDTTHNDKSLRIVSGTVGSGGSVAFSTLFGRTATDTVTLSQANLPNVNFTNSGIALNDPGHTHGLTAVVKDSGRQNIASGAVAAFGFDGTNVANTGSNTTGITVSAQGSAASGGSGTGHSHGMDMRVQYVDCIIASKN